MKHKNMYFFFVIPNQFDAKLLYLIFSSEYIDSNKIANNIRG